MSFLVDLVEIESDSWFTWWFNRLPGPSIFPERTPIDTSRLPALPLRQFSLLWMVAKASRTKLPGSPSPAVDGRNPRRTTLKRWRTRTFVGVYVGESSHSFGFLRWCGISSIPSSSNTTPRGFAEVRQFACLLAEISYPLTFWFSHVGPFLVEVPNG